MEKLPNGCWEWQGKLQQGYGMFYFENIRLSPTKMWSKILLAHRYSWELANGPIEGNLCVLHKCDNRPCVNPDHLFLGTRTDNNVDMVTKKRHKGPKGIRNPKAKLTEKQVKAIRAEHQQLRASCNQHTADKELGVKYNVNFSTIRNIVSRKTWGHVF